MELTHTFTVPTDRAAVWAAFTDIASVAECFPGAAVTSVDGDAFEGTCKVKLGPIALVYAGSGSFVTRDEDGGLLVMEAKGRDKRGNGTAGATVTAKLSEEGGATKVDVLTELQVTGKPAQFGRGLMQEVSDKLLEQFVACLQAKVTAPGLPPETVEASPEGATPAAASEAVSAPAGEPQEAAAPEVAAVAAPAAAAPSYVPPAPQVDDSIDLGATVLPVLLKSYWKEFTAGVLVLVLIRWLWSRRR